MTASRTSLLAPLMGRRPPSVDFIDNKAHLYHSAIPSGTILFEPESGKYREMAKDNSRDGSHLHEQARPKPSSERTGVWEQMFPLAMDQLKRKYPEEPKGRPSSGHSIRVLPSWHAVNETLLNARTAYESAGGFSGGLRKGCHRFGKHSQSLGQVVTLVPDIDYISPITSTIKIIVTAAQSSIQVRESIAEGMAKFEQQFEDIVTYSTIFRDDENIRDASVRLISSILKAVEDIIGYFIAHAARKAISAIFNGKQYQAALTESLESIQQDADTLLNQATNSNMWQTHQIWLATQSMVTKQEGHADLYNNMKQLLDELTQNLNHVRRQQEELKKLHHLYPIRLGAQCNGVACGAEAHGAPSWPPQETIQGMLGNSDIDVEDVEYILGGNGQNIPEPERARSERIVSTHQLQNWVVAPDSQHLLIHGNFRGAKYVSGLSWVVSSLHQSLRQDGRFQCLAFFCGRHVVVCDAHAGGRGLIRSLLFQLLRQNRFDIAQLGQTVNWALIAAGDVQHLCFLFYSLLHLLPPGSAVFCLIDGVLYYERANYVDDMAQVLDLLLYLTRPMSELSCIFKVLLTSPLPTTVVRQFVDPDRILSMASIPTRTDKSCLARVQRQLNDSMTG